MTSSPTDTHQLTATRYYSRDRTLVEAVAVYMAVGLSMTSVLSGSTVATSLGRVIAARNVGQCWGPAGSSVFSLPVDVCGGPSNKDETQLEAQGDLVVSVGLLSFGIVGLVSCAALYVAVKGYTWRAALEKLSILSILTPLWGAVLPILVGGAITAAVAPMSEEHPLAFLCEGSSGLIAVSFVLTVLLFIALSVVPLAAPALFRVACQRRSFTSQAIGSSLIARLMGWLRRSGRHEWFWKSTNAASAPSAHRIVRTLLLEYRALWYAALDFTDVCVVAI
ncbi:transmembrane protein, putative, partial [Bodo saltans]